ncbi:CheR family methyltransferase [Ligilactobacillus ruminis]|uniref:CheR family methyltransferase n=1 Tax=Ligilactobacillus ruminis TaxID=1623 RepID=UPI001899DBCE|nr:protein-glutamate O-methyltransferase CheR [Ligilactobacillus ruminis]
MAMNFDFFNKWVQDNLGIRLEAYKERQMQRRIGNIMQTTGAKTLEEYAKILSKDSKAREEFIEHLTINVTEFYRNKDIFDEFEDVLKKIVVKNTSRPKIWSAACSTGAEPYTLAMILDKNKINGSIVATDIDKVILDKAKSGRYSLHELKNVSKTDISNYFSKREDGDYEVNPGLKQKITFKRHDLLKDCYESRCDVIVCRNVTIYFKPDARDEVYQNFADALNKGGIFFTGATETINNPEQFGLKKVASFIYQKA